MTKLTEIEKITASMDVAVTYLLEERGYKNGEDFIVTIDTDNSGIEIIVSWEEVA